MFGGVAAACRRTRSGIDALIAQLSDPQLGVRQAALGELSLAGTHDGHADAARPGRPGTGEGACATSGRRWCGSAAMTELPLIGALDTTNEALKAASHRRAGPDGLEPAAVHLVRLAVDPNGVRRTAAAGGGGRAADHRRSARSVRGRAILDAGSRHGCCAGELPYRAGCRRSRGAVVVGRSAAGRGRRRSCPRGMRRVARPRGWRATCTLCKPGDNGRPAADAADQLASWRRCWRASIGRCRRTPARRRGGAGRPGRRSSTRCWPTRWQQGRVPAAIAAAELLGQSGDASVLQSSAGSASPLAEAMRHPDRRVRLAAALAAVKLAPGESFRRARAA